LDLDRSPHQCDHQHHIPANAADFSNGVLPTGTGTILAGQTSTTFNVLVQGDTTVEQNETFQMTLSNPVSANATFVLGAVAATSIILNEGVAVAGQVILAAPAVIPSRAASRKSTTRATTTPTWKSP